MQLRFEVVEKTEKKSGFTVVLKPAIHADNAGKFNAKADGLLQLRGVKPAVAALINIGTDVYADLSLVP